MTPTEIKAALKARKAARAEGPRTIAELAEAAGMDRTALQHAMNGRRPFPAPALARIVAILLGAT